MCAGFDLVLVRFFGVGEMRIIRGFGLSFAGGGRGVCWRAEAERGGRRVEEALFDTIHSALGKDVDAVDYVVEQALQDAISSRSRPIEVMGGSTRDALLLVGNQNVLLRARCRSLSTLWSALPSFPILNVFDVDCVL